MSIESLDTDDQKIIKEACNKKGYKQQDFNFSWEFKNCDDGNTYQAITATYKSGKSKTYYHHYHGFILSPPDSSPYKWTKEFEKDLEERLFF